jgi:putative ABC transport system ATP-binding protein
MSLGLRSTDLSNLTKDALNLSTPSPIIDARDLSRVYPLGDSAVVGLNRVSLTIAPGEMVVLKGNSGSGKSTLLSLLAGLDDPTEGRLHVAGYDLRNLSETRKNNYRRTVVGMIFQSFNLLPTMSVMENVCLPALLAGKPYPETIERAGELLGWLDMGARRGHRPAQLSGGEMQRTAIARALINDPALILADEPTGNLDSRNGGLVIDLLRELNRRWQRTVVIATHSNLADPFATLQICLKDGAVTDSTCDR